ncbi:hypothetical protein Acsp01_16600 [Actinoplanes sp. NBRC 101535]|nr:hypothetical protein Acsp01_16600 [Actinoplanes sp. NBRC 101535]
MLCEAAQIALLLGGVVEVRDRREHFINGVDVDRQLPFAVPPGIVCGNQMKDGAPRRHSGKFKRNAISDGVDLGGPGDLLREGLENLMRNSDIKPASGGSRPGKAKVQPAAQSCGRILFGEDIEKMPIKNLRRRFIRLWTIRVFCPKSSEMV